VRDSEKKTKDDFGQMDLTLDIDVSSSVVENIDTKMMRTLLDKMRDKKNRLFFGSLTDKALKPYL
jgi:uncharacterized protein (TIGR04255 family)